MMGITFISPEKRISRPVGIISTLTLEDSLLHCYNLRVTRKEQKKIGSVQLQVE
jgi:hypothetical protein